MEGYCNEKYNIVYNNIVYLRMLFDGAPGSLFFDFNSNNKERD